MSQKLPIRKRLALLTGLGALGGGLFTPFVVASPAATPPTFTVFLAFTFGSAVVTFFSAWLGLRWADRADLPMPWLRRLEQVTFTNFASSPSIFLPLLLGGGLGLAAAFTSGLLDVPSNPGSFLERIATTLFAAVVPEVVVHLLVMSGLILLFKRTWLGILLSAVLFVVLLHGDPPTTPLAVPVFVVGLNLSLGLLTGWMYARWGFGSAMLAYAAAHGIALGFN